MRALFAFLIAVILGLPAHAASIRFVTPQNGSQAVGVQTIEIATDATAVDRVEFSVDGVLAGVARKAPYRATYDFGDALSSHTVVAKLYSNGYRSVDSASITTAPLTAAASIDVDVVEIPLRVRTARPLRPSDLRVRENGVEQKVRDVLERRGSAHFVFVIDRSLSMGDGKLDETLRAVDAERALLRPDDRVSVVLFNHNVAAIRAVAPGEKLTSVFGNIVPSGGTSLRDALASIPANDRTYAIVISDGGDRNSDLGEEEALQRISGSRTIIDAIVLETRSRFLERAAANTGGDVVRASRGEIDRRLRELIEDINGRYLAVYQSSGTRRGWRSIDVRPRNRSVVIVASRKGYFAR